MTAIASSFDFPSKSSPGVVYTTVVAEDGKLLCDCRGWTMKRGTGPRDCTHTKTIAARLTRDGYRREERGDYVHLVRDGAAPPSAPATPAAAATVARATRAAKRDVVLCPQCRAALEVEPRGVICVVCGYTDLEPEPARPVSTQPPEPMLASAMTDPLAGEEFDEVYGAGTGWALEEKLDGHRKLVTVRGGTVTAYSRPRAGASAMNVTALPANIVATFATFPDGIYDGELWVPGGKASDVVVKGAALVFMLFDLLEAAGRSWMAATYAERRLGLRQIADARLTAASPVRLVPSEAPSWARVQEIWARGGEGAILKRLTSRYSPGTRSSEWVKVKTKFSGVFTVTGFEEGKSGPYSVIALRDEQGVETTVKTRNLATLRAIAANPSAFLGCRLVIAFQERMKGTNAPRHGIFDHFLDGPLGSPSSGR